MTNEPKNLMPLAASVASASGWDNATRAIMLAGKALPELPPELRAPQTYVSGCESDVWVAVIELNGRKVIAGWSPSKIIRGVLSIILEKANTLDPPARGAFDFDRYLTLCGLNRYLSQSRANGMKTVINRLPTLQS